MKKLILLLSLCIVTSQVYSQLLEEEFEYSDGDSLTQHGWINNTGVGTNTLFVTSPGLEFPEYSGSGLGNATTLKNTGLDVYKAFTSNRKTGSIYCSFMIKVDTARTGDYFIGFLDSGSTANFRGRVNARINAGALNFGISKGANNDTVVWAAQSYSFDTTYLVILKYTFVTGITNDLVSLFVFSPESIPPDVEPIPTIGPSTFFSPDAVNLGRLFLRQGTASLSPTLRLDGIYVDGFWDANFLPVELNAFTSAINGRNVTLHWVTVSEMNNAGFEIERLQIVNGGWSMVNSEWLKIGSVAGNGTTSLPKNYIFIDKGLNSGNYNYRLKQIDFNGNFKNYDLEGEVKINVPARFILYQNYPNPFNPKTIINYECPMFDYVSLKVYDGLGNEIATLVNEKKSPGYYTVEFDGSNFASGIYFYKIESGNFSATKKFILLK